MAALICAAFVLFPSAPSPAQSRDYQPVGARIGGLVLFPKVELSGAFDSNIFLEESDETADFISVVAPVLSAESDWNRHRLSAEAGIESGFFTNSEDDDYLDLWLLADGQVDLTRASQLYVEGLGFQREHEARGSDDVIATAAEPVVYHRYGGVLGARTKPNRASVEGAVSLFAYDYQNTDLIGGGAQSGAPRNRVDYAAKLRFGYEIQPLYETFIAGAYRVSSYDEERNAGGFDRDSQGYEIYGGLAFEPSPLVRADLALGYMARDYDDAALRPVNGPFGSIDATWLATPLMAVTLELSSNIDETTAPGAAGKRSYDLTLDIEYELLRNLVLTAGLGVGRQSFEGGESDRADDDFTVDLGARYWLTRNFFASAAFAYERRDSSADGFDYSSHMLSATIGAQF